MRISDWSSDVCSSDLAVAFAVFVPERPFSLITIFEAEACSAAIFRGGISTLGLAGLATAALAAAAPFAAGAFFRTGLTAAGLGAATIFEAAIISGAVGAASGFFARRSEEHTSELQSLMSNANARF